MSRLIDVLRDALLAVPPIRRLLRVSSPSAAGFAYGESKAHRELVALTRRHKSAVMRLGADVQPFVQVLAKYGRRVQDDAYLRAVAARELAIARAHLDDLVDETYRSLHLERPHHDRLARPLVWHRPLPPR